MHPSRPLMATGRPTPGGKGGRPMSAHTAGNPGESCRGLWLATPRRTARPPWGSMNVRQNHSFHLICQ